MMVGEQKLDFSRANRWTELMEKSIVQLSWKEVWKSCVADYGLMEQVVKSLLSAALSCGMDVFDSS
jgi:hypothetical protein